MALTPDIWRDFDRSFGSFGALTPWRPLFRQLDDLVNEAMTPLVQTRSWRDTMLLAPPCDVEELPDSYLLSFDMPGMKKEDISIELRGNQIIVSGERRFERKVDEANMQLLERRQGQCLRSMTLPSDVKSEGIEARYEDGVLNIAVPKCEASKSTKVKIGDAKSGFFKHLLSATGKKEGAEVNVQKTEASKGGSCA